MFKKKYLTNYLIKLQGSLSTFDIQSHVQYMDHPSYQKLIDKSSFDSCLHKQLKNIHCRPNLCIAFVSSHLYENFDAFFPSRYFEPNKKKFKRDCLLHKRKNIMTVLHSTIKEHLPADASVSFSIAPGIIACMRDYTPVEIEDGPAVTGFCFPKLPGVETHCFSVDDQKCNLINLIPKEKKIKCLLAFVTARGMSVTEKLIQTCLLRQEGKIAVGGAFVNHTESPMGSVIAFSGENIDAASLIICQNDTKEEIKNKLTKFQETGLLRNRCFAFMFACVARGYHFHRCHNFESDAFHSLYPCVPLIGVFGNGEIGLNYFPNLPTPNVTYRLGQFVRCIKRYRHSYTTVFVLLSVKK